VLYIVTDCLNRLIVTHCEGLLVNYADCIYSFIACTHSKCSAVPDTPMQLSVVLILSLFIVPFYSVFIASNSRPIVTAHLEGEFLGILLRNLPGETEENHERPR
jgi:hypothetical protein